MEENQIAFIVVKHRFSNSIISTSGTEIGSDHNPVVAKRNTKFMKIKNTHEISKHNLIKRTAKKLKYCKAHQPKI